MSDQWSTVLILGGTSGLGEAFVRRYHAEGKTVIAAGRRQERLQALQKELKGLEIQQIDASDIAALPSQISKLLSRFPKLDAVIAMAGIQKSFSFADSHATSPASISNEVTTNVTGPMVLAHLLIPHLLSLKPRPGTFVLVSSGLAFVPVPLFPVYCPTKAAIHSFAIALRAQLNGTSVRVVELAPPYVDTELDVGHREANIEQQGGPDKAVKPMGLKEYIDQAAAGLKDEGKTEVAVGFAEQGASAWRKTYGPVLEMMHVKGWGKPSRRYYDELGFAIPKTTLPVAS